MMKQKGMALIMVMLIVALATTITAFMTQQQSFWLRETTSSHDRAQARRLAEAGIDWARAILADDMVSNQFDHPSELWATQLPLIEVEGGEVKGMIRDQQGLFNLNNLTNNGVPNAVYVSQFQHLLDVLQLPQDLSDTLVDWMDADVEPLPYGAEDDYYKSLKVPYLCANRRLSDIGELTRIKGFTPEVVNRLQSFVSVLPETMTKINVNFANPEVLMAVIPNMSKHEAIQLAGHIKSEPIRSIKDLIDKKQFKLNQSNAIYLSVSSQYFMAEGYATKGTGEASINALLQRHGMWSKQIRKNLQ